MKLVGTKTYSEAADVILSARHVGLTHARILFEYFHLTRYPLGGGLSPRGSLGAKLDEPGH